MTVFAKPPITVKKFPLINEEEIIEMPPTGVRKRPSFCAFVCMGMTMLLFIMMGSVTVLQIYTQIKMEMRPQHHYQGVCSIPLTKFQDMQPLDSPKMQLRWNSTNNDGQVDSDVQVVSLFAENPDPDHLMDLLREVLDIDVDESVEKISVFNNGHPVSFIHNFESNFTGIVDSERCFTMDLDPELVLQPELFLFGLQHGDEFDVSRVRSTLRAVLPARHSAAAPPPPPDPALTPLRSLDTCHGKPTYRLQKETNTIIRKRAADAPPHDYLQFAGKRIQEIEISNLAELLEYEQNNKQAA